MPGRITPLRLPRLFAALLAILVAARDAQAHRLDAQAFVLPNRKVQVEGWFTGGDAAKGAKVQVFGAQEQLLTEGQLNEQGVFVFAYGEVAPHAVIISAGAGHRRVLSIAEGALERGRAETTIDPERPAKEVSAAPVPLAERDSGGPVKDVLVGVGFLLAVAAFVLSIRNAQKLRALGRPSDKAR
jgi:hypothetical protein